MTPFDIRHEPSDLALFTQFSEPPRKRACMVVLGDRRARFAVADHLEHLGYEVWTAAAGLEAYRLCLEFHENVDVLVCDDNLPDLPPLVLFHRLRPQLPWLQCCVLASVTPRPANDERPAAVVLDVVGWRAGMLFVNAVVPNCSERP